MIEAQEPVMTTFFTVEVLAAEARMPVVPSTAGLMRSLRKSGVSPIMRGEAICAMWVVPRLKTR